MGILLLCLFGLFYYNGFRDGRKVLIFDCYGYFCVLNKIDFLSLILVINLLWWSEIDMKIDIIYLWIYCNEVK